MNWIKYLLEANLYLVLFYAVYYLLLRRDTYYQLNRIYLLASSLVAFAIPLMQLGVLKPAHVAIEQAAAQVNSPAYMPVVIENAPVVAQATPVNYYLLVYLSIVCIMAIAFGIRIFQLAKLARNGKHSAGDNFKLVEIEDEDHAFSFFNYLFIGKKLTASTTIIQHELVHIRQKHSIDIVYLELLKIICWFNPVVYFLQNSIKEVHEFIADNHITAVQQDVNGYTDFLISNAYGLPEMALANNFFNKNLLKNRIMMLHQKRSGSLARLKLLVALPLLAGMLCLSTLGFTKDYSLVDLAPAKTAKQNPPPPPSPAAPTGIKYKGKQMPPPPPPIFLKPDYIELGIYMQNHLKYPQMATASNTAGTVILNFRVDGNHMITDVKIEKGIGKGLDEEAIRLITSFKKPVKDAPGYHTIGLNFNIKGVRFTETVAAAAKDKPGFVGELFLPGKLRFPPPVVKPNPAGKVPPPPPIDPSASKLPPPPPPKVDQVRFPPPKPKVDQVRFPPPVVRPDDTTGSAAFSDFYKQLGKTIRYAADARDNNIQGRVWVVFNIDDDRTIRNIKIIRGLTDVQNKEVIDRIGNCYVPASAKTGVNYSIAITFHLQGEDGKDIKSPPFKGKTYMAGYKPNTYPYKSLNEVVIVGSAVK